MRRIINRIWLSFILPFVILKEVWTGAFDHEHLEELDDLFIDARFAYLFEDEDLH